MTDAKSENEMLRSAIMDIRAAYRAEEVCGYECSVGWSVALNKITEIVE